MVPMSDVTCPHCGRSFRLWKRHSSGRAPHLPRRSGRGRDLATLLLGAMLAVGAISMVRGWRQVEASKPRPAAELSEAEAWLRFHESLDKEAARLRRP